MSTLNNDDAYTYREIISEKKIIQCLHIFLYTPNLNNKKRN